MCIVLFIIEIGYVLIPCVARFDMVGKSYDLYYRLNTS